MYIYKERRDANLYINRNTQICMYLCTNKKRKFQATANLMVYHTTAVAPLICMSFHCRPFCVRLQLLQSAVNKTCVCCRCMNEAKQRALAASVKRELICEQINRAALDPSHKQLNTAAAAGHLVLRIRNGVCLHQVGIMDCARLLIEQQNRHLLSNYQLLP